MDFKALLRNLLNARTALDVWKVVRAELMGFEWRKPNGNFERVTVIVPMPSTGERDRALTFELLRPLEWEWRPGATSDVPEWPDAYTARDARELGRQMGEAMLVALQPSPLEALAPTAPALPEPQAYERPELTAQHQSEAAQLSVRLTNGKSMKDVRLALVALLCENQRLTLEVNEHRAARGLELLPVFETNGRH